MELPSLLPIVGHSHSAVQLWIEYDEDEVRSVVALSQETNFVVQDRKRILEPPPANRSVQQLFVFVDREHLRQPVVRACDLGMEGVGESWEGVMSLAALDALRCFLNESADVVDCRSEADKSGPDCRTMTLCTE